MERWEGGAVGRASNIHGEKEINLVGVDTRRRCGDSHIVPFITRCRNQT